MHEALNFQLKPHAALGLKNKNRDSLYDLDFLQLNFKKQNHILTWS